MPKIELKGDPQDMQALEPMKDAPLAPAHTIAAVALNFALKYHDIGMIKDGTLYQQYKLEGRNFETLHLDHVFETAIKMERHLLASSQRIADIVVEALTDGIERAETAETSTEETQQEQPK